MVLVSVAGGPGTAMHGNQHGIGTLSFVREQNMELLGFRGVLSAIGNIHIHPAGLAFQRNLTGLGLVVPIAESISQARSILQRFSAKVSRTFLYFTWCIVSISHTFAR